jgi:hypothetical protein
LTLLLAKRRLGPWLLGLFLIAQIAGIVPAMSDHTTHLFESQPAVVDTHDYSAAGPRGDHRHGTSDIQDECCALHHHLAGVVPLTIAAPAFSLAAAPLVAPPLRALASADPVLLERPPKSLSVI